MSASLRLNSWLLPICVGALLVVEISDPSPIWRTLLVILGGAGVVGYFWARGLTKNLRLTREVRYGWVQVGDELEERFTVINAAFFPATWVEIEDHSTLPDYQASLATSVSGQGRTELSSRGRCARRGLYILGGTRLISGDPLGLFTVSVEDPASQTLLVLPPVIPLPTIEVTPGGLIGEGRPRSQSPEKTVGAAGVRAYQPGDPLRLIHWPTTAKHQQTFVRLLEGTPAADWWILLDLESAAQVGASWDSTEEHAVVLAASLADRGLRNRKAVGLAINGAEPCWKPPRDNLNQRWEILRALALARPGELSLAQYLQRNGKSFGKQASLVVITASLDPGWVEALAALRWRGLVPTILLVDPASYGGQGQASVFAARLQHLGLSCHVITRELLDQPEAHPGQQGRWEWRVSVTGKLIPIRKPVDSEWRRLA